MKIQNKQEIEFFGTKTGNANSIALGYATETKNFGEVAVGVMNKSTAAKDPNSAKGVCVDSDATLFSVGCGGSGERKNALEVKGDGSVIISGKDGDINVADKIKEALDTDKNIELVKSTDSDLQYTLMVNNESRGSINIPKDQFLKSVSYDEANKQLVFTFVTMDEDEHIERVPIDDLKDVYTAGEGISINNNVISADFSSVNQAISDEKTQRETTDNEIKSTLDTKADETELEKQVEYLKAHSFYLGDEGQVAGPFKAQIFEFDKNIQETKNNEEYAYADISWSLGDDEEVQRCIYDKSLDKTIKITGIGSRGSIDTEGDYFRTAEHLDLSHTFYLDNEKTGDTENLDELTIEESDVFKTLPYIDTSDTLKDDTTPQYIYDATDRKWIEIVETWYLDSSYYLFNTEEPLDLTHELGYCDYSTIWNYATTSGTFSTALGYGAIAKYGSTALGWIASANNNDSVAIGHFANATGGSSTALGPDTHATRPDSTALGKGSTASGDASIALGSVASASGDTSIALGSHASTTDNNSIAFGGNASAKYRNTIALGYNANATNDCSIAIGIDAKTVGPFTIALGNNTNTMGFDSIALGSYASTNGSYSIALGNSAKASADNTIVIGQNNYSSNSACYSLSSAGTPLMEVERNKKGLYLQGLGGYNGTNLVIKNNNTETLNPQIKSVQQLIDEKAVKADVDAALEKKADETSIPTKLSQLTNDAKYITKSDIPTVDLTPYATKEELNEVKQDVEHVKDDLQYVMQQETILDQVSYGIEWDNSTASSDCVRIGNLAMHKSLPIQSQMKGVIHQHGVIQYYLDPNDWSKKADGTPSRLDGYDGEIGVTIPKFYLWSETEGTKRRVRISEIKAVPHAQEIPAHIIGAKKPCQLKKVPENMGYLSTLPVNSLVSICNDSDYCCGAQSTTNDSLINTYPERCRFGKQTSGISRATARQYAKLAGNQLQMYDQYKALMWLYYIEYANLDCQTEFNAAPTSEGYKQGGLGTGCTNISYDVWYTFNEQYPIFKNDAMNSYGNFTASKSVTLPAYNYNTTSSTISQYAKNSGTTATVSNNVATITNATNNELYSFQFYRGGTIVYTVTGATEANPIIFYEDSINSPVASATSDGDITVIWNNNTVTKHIGIKTTGSCNVTITVKSFTSSTIQIPAMATWVNSYRGIQEPFGDTWTNIDGIIVNKKSDGVNNIYVTDNINFGDDVSKMKLIGEYDVSSDWLKDLNIGEHGDLLSVTDTYAKSKFKDYRWDNNNDYDRLFLVGGPAGNGSGAGLAVFDSHNGLGTAWTYFSFRITTMI